MNAVKSFDLAETLSTELIQQLEPAAHFVLNKYFVVINQQKGYFELGPDPEAVVLTPSGFLLPQSVLFVNTFSRVKNAPCRIVIAPPPFWS